MLSLCLLIPGCPEEYVEQYVLCQDCSSGRPWIQYLVMSNDFRFNTACIVNLKGQLRQTTTDY
jgi:hypothetical protein